MVTVPDRLFDPTDIIAHIFFAVGTVDEVVVTSVAGEFVGTMCYPDDDGVLIRQDQRPFPLPPGSPVCVEYTGPGDHYRFYTEVLRIESTGARINVPRAIERHDRRLMGRTCVSPEAGFGFRATDLRGSPVFGVHDLSTGGVGLGDVNVTAPAIGELIVGQLILPGVAAIQMCLEVRNAQIREGKLLLGTRITGITTLDRGRLAKFLVRWSRQN